METKISFDRMHDILHLLKRFGLFQKTIWQILPTKKKSNFYLTNTRHIRRFLLALAEGLTENNC